MEFQQFTSPTLVTRDPAAVRAFHAEHKDIILKPLDGMGGMGIFRVREGRAELGSITETLNKNGAETAWSSASCPRSPWATSASSSSPASRCPSCWRASRRAPRCAATWRQAARAWRSRCPTSNRKIAEAVGRALAPRGLLLIGLDVIGDFVTEINVTSPTCFQEISDQTGFDVPRRFINALEESVNAANV